MKKMTKLGIITLTLASYNTIFCMLTVARRIPSYRIHTAIHKAHTIRSFHVGTLTRHAEWDERIYIEEMHEKSLLKDPEFLKTLRIQQMEQNLRLPKTNIFNAPEGLNLENTPQLLEDLIDRNQKIIKRSREEITQLYYLIYTLERQDTTAMNHAYHRVDLDLKKLVALENELKKLLVKE
jgi:hypothetical protein